MNQAPNHHQPFTSPHVSQAPQTTPTFTVAPTAVPTPAPSPANTRVSSNTRIPTPPALIALFVLSAIPGLVGATFAVVGLVNDRDVLLLSIGANLVLTTLGLYFLLVLPLVAIIQAIHQTITFRRN
ncbi:hypothetical protein [Agromyces allii]|uniref:Uncharacterized protein n=1 Tax=Agromyces allii TaxID=393607 RepID=A0ABN2PZU4_9MICO|nr:hypothetical protein [Agromyces allii]